MNNTGLYRYVYDFSLNYNSIDVDDILNIHKYEMIKNKIKCLDVLKNVYWIINCLHNRKFW